MPTLDSILADLQGKGSEQTRKTYARHGMDPARTLGVSIADLKPVAKTIKGQQALAYELYETGFMEPMYLAGMVASGARMEGDRLQHWAEGAAGMQMIAEYTVPWVTVEHADGRTLAMQWIASKEEHVASAGWCTYSGLVGTQPDAALDLGELETLLDRVVRGIGGAPDRVRYTMNGFVISVGAYVEPLRERAKAAAREMGAVSVEMGDTACKVPAALGYIEKIEAAGRAGRKRKTIRC